jgi:polyhydroxybutyrate depolymerase
MRARVLALRPSALAAFAALTAAACDGEQVPHAAAPAGPSATVSSAAAAPSSAVAPSVAAPPATPTAAPVAPVAPAADAAALIHAPKSMLPGEKRPFVLYLHGLGASGKLLLDVLHVPELAQERKFVYAAPDGALDGKKRRFWNASAACCNEGGLAVDHVKELGGIVEAARARPDVDPQRIYVLGFSNGGFMAHRLACDVPGIAAIASIAGAGPASVDPPCLPKNPVGVLQVHGDADDVIRLAGGHALGNVALPVHPSAQETVLGWATRNGAKNLLAPAKSMDLVDGAPGYETSVFLAPAGRAPVELWVVHEGGHLVASGKKSQQAVLSFLEQVALPKTP